MIRKLVDEVNISELQTMRAEGMSNSEIAESLNCSIATIYKYIGKQPSGLRKKRGGEKTPRVAVDAPQTAPACLVMQNMKLILHGVAGAYEIDCKAQYVDINMGDDTMRLNFDKLAGVIDELRAIQRKLESLNVEHEMW